MPETQRSPEHRREYIADGSHSALRATWHNDSGYVVLSLWRGDTCVATSHLTPAEAGRLARFITGGLADLATEALGGRVTPLQPQVTVIDRLRRGIGSWRRNLSWSLEAMARKLR